MPTSTPPMPNQTMPNQTMPQYSPLTLRELHHKLGELLTQQSPNTPTNVLQVEVVEADCNWRVLRLWTVSHEQSKNRPAVVEDQE